MVFLVYPESDCACSVECPASLSGPDLTFLIAHLQRGRRAYLGGRLRKSSPMQDQIKKLNAELEDTP